MTTHTRRVSLLAVTGPLQDYKRIRGQWKGTSMERPGVHKAIRFVVLWVIGFALVSALLWVADTAHGQCTRTITAQSGSCYPRSATPRRHHRHYVRGDYGHAHRHLDYSHRAKRIIVNRVMAKWPERWGAKNRPEAWHRVIRHDNCAVPANKYAMSCHGIWQGHVGKAITANKTTLRVTVCGVTAALAWTPEGAGAAAALGSGGVCAFAFWQGL